ncbi:hypothetical protein BDW66DRAFT_130926 [Aspergillus desertorum]
MTDEASRRPLGEHHDNGFSPSQEQFLDQQRRSFEVSSESTPLLHRREDDLSTYGGIASPRPTSAASGAVPPDNYSKRPRNRVRWTVLCGLLAISSVVVILILAFIVPAVVKQYVKEAAVIKPTNLSVVFATSEGIRARVRGDVVLDANRVESGSARNIGRFVTWIGGEVETGQSEVNVYLPEYGNALVGSASLPSIKISIRNGHVNHLDFEADLVAGSVEGLRSVAVDWLEGRLDRLSLQGSVILHLKSGLLSLGEQTLADSIVFEGNGIPSLPAADITKFNVHDVGSPNDQGAMAVDVSVSALLGSPFSLRIPPLGFTALVANCSPRDPYISVADVVTQEIAITPNQSAVVDVSGIIRGLPDELTADCPGEKRSPLDTLLTSYIHGSQTVIYVRGADVPFLGTPRWMTDILKTVTVPLSFTGHALDNLVKNFSMTDVHFTLPNPVAEPDSPESRPTVSALVKVLISVPEQVDFNLDVPRVRAKADVYYQENKLGVLDLKEWQPANSTLIRDFDNTTALQVKFSMDEAPLEVTDEEVLTDVLSSLIFEGNPVRLTVSANVDAEISTGLGKFAVRGIPADGKLTVEPPFGGLHRLEPQVESLELGATTESSLLVETVLNFTNPTQYAASVPLLDLLLVYNDTKVAHLTAKNVTIVPGTNTGINVNLQWCPLDLGGPPAVLAGQDLISRFISGFNTSATMKTHEGTIPALPKLGQALSRLSFEVQIPNLSRGGDPDTDPDQPGQDGGHNGFIQDATLHLWSSTAEFALFSPLNHAILEITSIEARAFYEHDHEVGAIKYFTPFSIPPGLSHSPRLPVDLNLGGIGYDAVKRAVGGTLDLDTVAKVGVRIEKYIDTVHYRGKGIKAKVKL